LVAAIAFANGCGSGDSGAGGDAAGGGGGDASAEGGSDATEGDAADGAASCPSHQPRDGDACTGSASCGYGHSVCCGIDYTAFTCECQQGMFMCALTVECNIVCPDGGPGDSGSD
jgi:hypothetical protein